MNPLLFVVVVVEPVQPLERKSTAVPLQHAETIRLDEPQLQIYSYKITLNKDMNAYES